MATLDWQEQDTLPDQWKGTAVIAISAPISDTIYHIQQYGPTTYYVVRMSSFGIGTLNMRIGDDTVNVDQAKNIAQIDWDSFK